MTKTQNLFFSCIDSRIQNQGSMYARFHLGVFLQGQGLTFGNALRRTLLAEVPGLIMSDIQIQGASHQFATLPGVEETVFDILLNLKKLVFSPSAGFETKKLNDFKNFQATGFLKNFGPTKVTAKDLKLPLAVKCVDPTIHIATLTSGANLELRFNLKIQNPAFGKFESFDNQNYQPISNKTSEKTKFLKKNLFLESVGMPITKVNYVIKPLDSKQGSEYIVLEVWTDGSIRPQDGVQFALKKLTDLFFQFALDKNFY